MTEIPRYRCGYCSSPSDEDGRCEVCGSALYDCHRAISGARNEEYIKRALKSRDRAWRLVDSMREELNDRRIEDHKENRDPSRFESPGELL